MTVQEDIVREKVDHRILEQVIYSNDQQRSLYPQVDIAQDGAVTIGATTLYPLRDHIYTQSGGVTTHLNIQSTLR